QHYRDNRLNPIHEGTHGIQALDLLGRKVVMRGGAGLRLLRDEIGATTRRAATAGSAAQALATQLGAAADRVIQTTQRVWAPGEPETALASASVYLEAVGHIVIAWMWLEQLLATGDRKGDFYAGKRHAARYFFRYELPKTGPQFDLLDSCDHTTTEMADRWF
ncbi:MAG: acyl-CoA dehydrogenase, partial [Frankiaceae bacterium]